MKKILNTLAIVALGFALYAPNALAAAFGVSPPWIENAYLKPGSNFVYVIDLSTNDPREDMVVTAKISGDAEIAQWLSIKDKDNLVMPMGQNHTAMYVEVNVPQDAKLGSYKGNLSLTASPRHLKPDSVSILLGGNIAVNLKVIDQDVVDYWVRNIDVQPIVDGQPLRLQAEVKNLGNTVIGTLELKAQAIDMSSGKTLATFTGGTLTRPVYPQTMGITEVNMSGDPLPVGTYWLKVSALRNGKSVYSNKLYQEVLTAEANNIVKTSVNVAQAGSEGIRPAAPAEIQPAPIGSVNVPTTVNVKPQGVDVRTSVTVRAPVTNQLIMVVIGLLLVIVGISYRIYVTMSKSNRHHH